MQLPRSLSSFLLLLCCGSTALVHADELAARQQEAMEIAQSLMQQLKHSMKHAMKNGGVTGAIEICAERAPAIAGEVSRARGWKVTRVSTRVRNPMLGMPDAYEQQVLSEFKRRMARGESPKGLISAAMVEEPDGRYFRFMRAITVQPQCLTCHGAEGDIPSAVAALLNKRYPHDQATGYGIGDLRGAVSIKYRVDGEEIGQ